MQKPRPVDYLDHLGQHLFPLSTQFYTCDFLRQLVSCATPAGITIFLESRFACVAVFGEQPMKNDITPNEHMHKMILTTLLFFNLFISIVFARGIYLMPNRGRYRNLFSPTLKAIRVKSFISG